VQFPQSYPMNQSPAGAPVGFPAPAFGQPPTGFSQAPPPGFGGPAPAGFAGAPPAGFPSGGNFPPPTPFGQQPPAPPAPPRQQSPAQAAQQAYQQRLIGVARTLEQQFPDYQILVSMFAELFNSPAGETITGAEPLMATMKELCFHHTATLGAIRRFLYGEATPVVLSDMAVAIMQLGKIHSMIQPLLDRLMMSSSQEMRGPLGGLAQSFASSGLHLSQATQAMQATVGPQIWEAAQQKVHE
jgi:hypothetical protein